MTFVHPEFLYLMLPALMVLFYFLMTGEEEHYKFFSPEVLQKLQVSANTLTMRSRNAIFFIMFALLITALAQPVIEDGKVKVKAKSSDIMIALDISDSMLAQDIYPTRLDAAKKKIMDLLNASPQERIGVMAFAKDAYLVSPLSFDHRAVRFLLKQINTASITQKGTDFMRLLSSAKGAFKGNDNRYLLILTDGADKSDFSEEITRAKKEGIRLFILGLGTKQGAPIKLKDGSFIKQNGNIIVSKLNSAIKTLALETGGAYIESVTSSEDIKAMRDEIEAKTEKRELKEEEITLYIQLFYYPLGLAMFLLIIATSSMSKRERLVMPHLFVVMLLGLHVSDAEAGLLDFQLLDKAKQSYEHGDFNSSCALYTQYLDAHPSAQSYYDRANADYKKGNYKAAATGYKQVHTSDKNLQFNTFHNLGNAYAKQGDSESLQKAIESYEKALKIREEKETLENLEAVEKALKKQQQQNDQKNAQDRPESKHKNSQKKRESDPDQKQNEQKDQNTKNKEQEQKPAQQQEQKKQKDEIMSSASPQKSNQMSDREAEKWMQLLQDKPVGHLYQLNSHQRSLERDKNEKPW